MTRNETIELMMNKANEMYKKGWNFDDAMEIWTICSDWNSEHYGGMYDEAEIFMCDYQSDDSDHVNGFMIEDDFWTFEDM